MTDGGTDTARTSVDHLAAISEDLHEIRRTQVLFRRVMIGFLVVYLGIFGLAFLGVTLVTILGGGDDSVGVHYEVSGASGVERATVTYTEPEGREVTEDVTLPWSSEEWTVDEIELLSVRAIVDGDAGDLVTCQVLIDQGVNDRLLTGAGEGSCEATYGDAPVSDP